MIENEQVDVECERVDINRIVTDCLIEKYYEFGEIQPTIQTENTPVWIYGNNLICKRIIENLIYKRPSSILKIEIITLKFLSIKKECSQLKIQQNPLMILM